MSVHFRTAGPSSDDPRVDRLEKRMDDILRFSLARMVLNDAVLSDLLAIAADHDTGALYERLEVYRKQLKEISQP